MSYFNTPADAGMSGWFDEQFDSATDWVNEQKDSLLGNKEDVTEEIETQTGVEISEEKQTPQNSMVEKAKAKFNETSPTVMGGVAGAIAKFGFNQSWLTTGIVAVAGYMGKKYLDEKGGLSEYIDQNEIQYIGTSNNKPVYASPSNRAYYTPGLNGQMKRFN